MSDTCLAPAAGCGGADAVHHRHRATWRAEPQRPPGPATACLYLLALGRVDCNVLQHWNGPTRPGGSALMNAARVLFLCRGMWSTFSTSRRRRRSGTEPSSACRKSRCGCVLLLVLLFLLLLYVFALLFFLIIFLLLLALLLVFFSFSILPF